VIDVFSQAVRSHIMRSIKSKDTKPELLVRKALHARGLRFRLHVKSLPGRPDLVLPRYKAVIFVNGCFWHGHRCRLSSTPKTRTTFWLGKISTNMNRDRYTHGQLLDAGWRLAVVWECALVGRHRMPLEDCIDQLVAWIKDPRALGIELEGVPGKLSS
jgi:DNA mismatch endonuclease (patch repair protein)